MVRRNMNNLNIAMHPMLQLMNKTCKNKKDLNKCFMVIFKLDVAAKFHQPVAFIPGGHQTVQTYAANCPIFENVETASGISTRLCKKKKV